ncbi:nucleotide/sugar transporter family protein [Striga asiatica]|uniref:Nucleotide/sugar transporter family protein n=1 Tax=Striga asiatica TaxID=4170 RepID=A0A5A7QLH6_STRAF|nr:nucleotide/sugar transporter family protein [Striga asiatica]
MHLWACSILCWDKNPEDSSKEKTVMQGKQVVHWKKSEALFIMIFGHRKELNANNSGIVDQLWPCHSILWFLLVMGRVGFNYPIFLTLIHYTTAWLLMAFFKALSLLPVSPPSKSTPFSSLFALGAVMAFASGLANTSLKHNSVGFYQMAKIAVTPTIVTAEFILFKKTISFSKVVSLVVVSFGVAVATVTDLEFNMFGAFIAVAWIIPSAINKILWSNLQQQGNWTALALMWKTTPVTIFFLVALMPWLDPPGVLLFKWNMTNTTAVLISALLGFLLQWSGALALGATSATSHVVLGQFKTCIILLGGYILFGSDPGPVSIVGAILALCGMSVYTSLNLKGSVDMTTNLLPSQNLPSAKPKSIEYEEKPVVEDNTVTV